MTESFRTQDGRTLTYRREGEGAVLVCHPGGPGFSSLYLADLAGLGADFTLIFLDPRGTAASTAPDDARSYATADYVADVEELRLQLGEDKLNILGHSHGGVVAIAYAAEHPERVRRLVAANSLVRLHQEEMDALMLSHRDEPWYDDARLALDQENAGEYENEAELAEITRRFWPMYFAHFDERAAEYLDEYVAGERPNPDPLRVFNESIETWDIRSDLVLVKSPTLVITGSEDFICGPACADDIAEGIVGSRKVVIEDCGHFSFVECRERFREEVAAFLDLTEEAAEAIRRGRLVILPMDTLYALATTATREEPVRGLYRAKGRPPPQPTALIAPDLDTLFDLVPELRGRSGEIARALLPGPYTLVLPNPARRFRWLTGSNVDAIGVRVPNLPEPSGEILRRVNALAGTSANLAGGPDPVRFEDVPEELIREAAVAIDGGELPGVASTVIDFSAPEPRVIREGAASSAEAIERARAATS